MPFITFIYRIGKNTYYGKYCFDYISDDHEGLDNEVKYELLYGLSKFKNQKIKAKVSIGVLSFSSNDIIPTYSTTNEIKCFDFYRDQDKKIYINGKLIPH